MKRGSDRKKLIRDLVLAGSLLLAAVILLLVINGSRESGGVAVVRVDGVETERLPLSVNGTFPLNGGSNILIIQDGQAWMSEANCPDLICVRQGIIHYTGQVITCLPNRLTVTIEGGESGGVDLIVG
ncbi:MAG: NusG domain II-containing protein [Oscillospiraceae bacterium]|nr:NusG domain II-containing protein [Oscillospiraceae bacterium]